MYSVREVILLILCLIIVQTVDAQEGNVCKTPNGEEGICKSIYSCNILLDAVKQQNTKQLKFVKNSSCGKPPLVCCGSDDNWKPDRSNCGFQVTNKMYGLTVADFDEFSWLALLEYKNASNYRKFLCGGVIISKRYVLTAAHCVNKSSERLGQLVNVRLGEFDLRQEIDCNPGVNLKDCNKPPENFGISEILIHPNHSDASSKGAGDIALIKLDRDITFSVFIRPICLPYINESSAVGYMISVSGWGRTDNATHSPIKRKAILPVVDRSQCVSRYPSLDIRTQICAGGEEDKDDCFGDSGGPLMTFSRDTGNWYVAGIFSFGQRCGEKGWPAVYTNVSEYLDWIMEHSVEN